MSEKAGEVYFGPETFEQFQARWTKEMETTLLDYSDFGHYCHGGADLVTETEERLGEPLDSATYFSLTYEAGNLVYELEERICSVCQDHPALDTGAHPADVIDEVLLAWKPGHFKEARDLARAAMLKVGLSTADSVDPSLESLAYDLLQDDDRGVGRP